jgi:mannose-6-phosphate isomerase-like protein (cupin superfamily)
MDFGRNDPSKYFEAKNCHSGAGTIKLMSLWDKFDTTWMFIHRGVLPPKSGIGHHFHDNCEEMYVIFNGSALFTNNGYTGEFKSGAMVPCFAGESHGIHNHTDEDIQFINFGVGDENGKYDNRDLGESLEKNVPDSPDKIIMRYIDRGQLAEEIGSVHQGKGKLLFRRIWSHESFKTNWGFIDHILLPPDSSIGYHRHKTIEECYIILDGKGRMTMDDETVDAIVGDAYPNKLGGCHGIYNNSNDYLEVLNMAVSLEKGKFDAEDLGDDLSSRL